MSLSIGVQLGMDEPQLACITSTDCVFTGYDSQTGEAEKTKCKGALHLGNTPKRRSEATVPMNAPRVSSEIVWNLAS